MKGCAVAGLRFKILYILNYYILYQIINYLGLITQLTQRREKKCYRSMG